MAPTATLGVMNYLVMQQSCDITLQLWDVEQQLWDVIQQLWDSHNTPWNFAEALSLSHCLLHKLCDCCTAVRQTDNCRHKRRALCANPLHKIIHTPGYVRFRIVQPKQSLGHRIDLKLITKIYVNNGITLDCLWGRKGRASIFAHNYIRSGHCFRIPSHGYSIWVWRGHKYLSRRASVVLSSDCC